MASARDYLANWFRWRSGRQQSGYEKMLLLVNPLLLPFDLYLLRFKPGSEIAPHTDPVTDKRHYRLNIILKNAGKGGEFFCPNPIYENRRIKFFRPDQQQHGVSRVDKGTRYVLSIGWVLR